MCSITVNCSCTQEPQEPPPAGTPVMVPPPPGAPLGWDGWMSSAHPDACTSSVQPPAEVSAVYMARLVQPAGLSINGVWVTTCAPASGLVSGESRVAVYAEELGTMSVYSSVPRTDAFSEQGNRRWRLESEPGVPNLVPAPATDRFVWVAVLVAAYTTPPKLLSTRPVELPGLPGGDLFLKNSLFGMRSRVGQRATLPPVELVSSATGYGDLTDRVIMVIADDWN
ncbi:hypothetical protein ABT158_03850 [Nonomuraea sp. NPDC001636]|uniref:hypothetical protein n=1 Tax=Nonomuraea sp. NPDC001636 TaxID=3154391 RepID=UPI0033307B0B